MAFFHYKKNMTFLMLQGKQLEEHFSPLKLFTKSLQTWIQG
jgi:hypothetical protein